MSLYAEIYIRSALPIESIAIEIEKSLGIVLQPEVDDFGNARFRSTSGSPWSVLAAATFFGNAEVDEDEMPISKYNYSYDIRAERFPDTERLYFRLGGHAYRAFDRLRATGLFGLMMVLNSEYMIDRYEPDHLGGSDPRNAAGT